MFGLSRDCLGLTWISGHHVTLRASDEQRSPGDTLEYSGPNTEEKEIVENLQIYIYTIIL